MTAWEGYCPARTCRATPGEPCRTSTGAERSEPHGLRWLNGLPGPLARCPGGPCDACRWTGWAQDDGKRLSKMLFAAREAVDIFADLLANRAPHGDSTMRRLVVEIDDYRAERGWSLGGYGWEGEEMPGQPPT